MSIAGSFLLQYCSISIFLLCSATLVPLYTLPFYLSITFQPLSYPLRLFHPHKHIQSHTYTHPSLSTSFVLEWIVVELFTPKREDWTSNNESVKEKSGAHTTATPRIIFISGVLSLEALVGSDSGKHESNCRERVKHRHGR